MGADPSLIWFSSAFNLFGSSSGERFERLGFVYSDQHVALNDSISTALLVTLGMMAFFVVML